MSSYAHVTDWTAFVPTTPDEVLTKIEHLLKITTDTFRADGSQQGLHNVSKKPRVARKAKEDASTTTSTGRRKGEKEEDRELLEQESKNDNLTTGTVTQPPNFVGQLRDYQLEGLRWMVELYDTGVNGILADEMGLGKTAQTISLLAHLNDIRGISGKHLIIVPKSTMGNWAREFSRFYPTLKLAQLLGTKDERPEIIKTIPACDVILTTYEMCIIEATALKKFKYEYIILDEAHRIKNDNAKISITIRAMDAAHRLLITGTPINNNLDELWSLLNFLRPDLFHSNDEFRLLFDETSQAAAAAARKQDSMNDNNDNEDDDNIDLLKEESSSPKQAEFVPESQSSSVERLQRILRPFLLRRLKIDVAKQLPPKIETKVYVKLSKLQRQQYKGLLAQDHDVLNANSSSGAKPRLLNLAMQLRKCSNHPYLFDGVEPEPFENGPHLVQASGKLMVLDKLLTKLFDQGSRVLIFSQMSRMLDILDDFCSWKGYKFCRIDGQTDHASREDLIDDFNRPGSDKFVFLLSTRAGGLGINLQTADTVVLYDSDWNPQMDLQAMDRAHRIGQTKQVNVFRLVTDGTIEEKIVERALKKLALDALIIQKGRQGIKTTAGPSANEMQAMVRFGADKICRLDYDDEDDPNIDVDALLEEAKNRTKSEQDKMNRDIMDLSCFSLSNTDSAFDIRTLEGQSFDMITNSEPFYIEPPSRTEINQYQQEMQFTKALDEKNKLVPPPKPYAKFLPDYHLYLNYDELMALNEKQWNYRERFRVFSTELKNREAIEKAMSYISPSPRPVFKVTHVNESKYDGLTEEEAMRREALLATGFPGWTKRHVEAFFVACYCYGTKNVEEIAKNIPGKTVQEAKDYYQAFVQRVDFAIEQSHLKDNDKMDDEEDAPSKLNTRFLCDISTEVTIMDENDQPIKMTITQNNPIQLKDIKTYISRARSLAAFSKRQQAFRERLRYKIKEAIETYQSIVVDHVTAGSRRQPIRAESKPSLPLVSSFFECLQLNYCAPPKAEVIQRSIPTISRESVAQWLKYFATFATKKHILAHCDHARDINVVDQYYRLPEDFKGSQQKLMNTISSTAKYQDISAMINLRNVSPHGVPLFGMQFTPVQDAMILYALFRSDLSLPYLTDDNSDESSVPNSTTPSTKPAVVANSVASLLTNTFSLENCHKLLKLMPFTASYTGGGMDWFLLSQEQLTARLSYLVTIIEGEPSDAVTAAKEVVKVDHERDTSSWFNTNHLKRLGYAHANAYLRDSNSNNIDDDEDEKPAKNRKKKATTGDDGALPSTKKGRNSADDDGEVPAPKVKKGRRTPEEIEADRLEKERAKAQREKAKQEREAEKEREKQEKERVRLEKQRVKQQQEEEKQQARLQKRLESAAKKLTPDDVADVNLNAIKRKAADMEESEASAPIIPVTDDADALGEVDHVNKKLKNDENTN